ncbi:hypothetical protein MNR01_14035 [Lysobacter sp. S4-A87]|uniref:hypothetical protein n=1 Tax=Lysobacter sp. S4-A87 TaxID=2925843 RepID=UPI001F5331A9|nr:hypothetical protein [Lysobacter sp. S4-A87]UNK48849.1 hypothetical protein MNR01_14035 [Lysobacter sp. S4-A87]
MRFSARTPKWVKDEFEAISAESSSDIQEILRKVLDAPSDLSGPVWRGLEKRAMQHRLGSLGKLDVLANSVRKGLRPRVGDALLSPKEKLAKANRLARAAKEFAEAWRDIGPLTHGQVAITLGGRVGMAASEMLGLIEPYASRWRERKLGDDTVCASERVLLDEAFRRIDVVADAVAEGAKVWARTKAPLDKPNHQNADRLWFIRVVTESFVYHFASPMREEVAALTKIWFGDSKLTANTLSEIASVEDAEAVRWPSRLSQKRPPSK